jgi:hypothetical protein
MLKLRIDRQSAWRGFHSTTVGQTGRLAVRIDGSLKLIDSLNLA